MFGEEVVIDETVCFLYYIINYGIKYRMCLTGEEAGTDD